MIMRKYDGYEDGKDTGWGGRARPGHAGQR